MDSPEPKFKLQVKNHQILSFTASDIAVAVAVDGGLLTPVLLDVEKKSLQEISIEMKTLAERARQKNLLPNEYQGGSFSISSLGMMGIKNKLTATFNIFSR